jgi:hypothetical protein
MTTPNQILVLLKDCPSTTDAIAERVSVPMLVAKAMLERAATDGYTTSAPAGDLILWSLTSTGLELAIALQNHAA